MMMNLLSPLEIDHDSAESTLSNSFESGFADDADSKMDDCTDAWTNEKHNSYLDSLESSFVRQLYTLVGGETQRLSRTQDSRKSTNQLRVLQGKCNSHKVKRRAHLGTSSEFRFQMNMPESCQEGIGNYGDNAYYTQTLVGRDYPSQSVAEAGGHNFGEEREENESVSEVTTKRRREANYDDSSLKDQVVP